ncbi:hypothetical protein B0H16DRAFT_1699915 [Mycena metata]|uniref:Uncharacterized protein n=1 Tax=Mycena metata TaxID=1033252 RepID=A0AAD7HHC1_9AGAR|nr:hypothetical protein B0H16DRAFT_1699915 [Mycena metata]
MCCDSKRRSGSSCLLLNLCSVGIWWRERRTSRGRVVPQAIRIFTPITMPSSYWPYVRPLYVQCGSECKPLSPKYTPQAVDIFPGPFISGAKGNSRPMRVWAGIKVQFCLWLRVEPSLMEKLALIPTSPQVLFGLEAVLRPPRTPAFTQLVSSCTAVGFRSHACAPLGVLMLLPVAELVPGILILVIPSRLIGHSGATPIELTPAPPVQVDRPIMNAWPMDNLGEMGPPIYVQREVGMNTDTGDGLTRT